MKTGGSHVDEYLKVNRIYHGDARMLLPKIESDSISLSFWSPPYHLRKEYEAGQTYEEWLSLLRDVIALHFPIIKPGGFLVVNIGDILTFQDPDMPRIQAMNPSRQIKRVTREDVIKAQAENPNFSRYQLAELLGVSEQTIDRRLHGNNIRGGKHQTQTRVKIVGGLIEDFGIEAGFYMYDRRIWVKDPAWANCEWHSLSYRSVDESEYLYILWKPGITLVDREKLTPQEWSEWGSRGVWNIPSVRANIDHEAMFPLELARRVVKLFSAKGETVLDCFIGSGTTAIAAIIENRNYIGIDKESKYVELAIDSCKSASQRYNGKSLDKEYSSKKNKEAQLLLL
jgi:DNA modification methylase